MSEAPNYETLIVEQDNGWVTIWLNRPEARNALSDAMVSELTKALSDVAQSHVVRGVTLRGKGGVFCAGGDLKGFQAAGADRDEAYASSMAIGELLAVIAGLPQVVIMLVEGAAMAGGLGMICAGDVVVVTRDAKFALSEVTLGIPPAQIAPYVVARLGLSTARRLMLTAARFDGEEAGRNGLADQVVADADGLSEVEADLRQAVMRCAPGAIAVTKDLLEKLNGLSGGAMREFAAKAFADALHGDEAREGIAAFFEKRKPNWRE